MEAIFEIRSRTNTDQLTKDRFHNHSSRIRFLRFFENPKNATFYVF